VAAGRVSHGEPVLSSRAMRAEAETPTPARLWLPRRIARPALFGALGGLYGAGAMSLVRLAARRAGLIDKMVPQAVEEWLMSRIDGRIVRDPTAHHVLDQLLHLAYGVAWGAIFAPLLERGRRQGLWPGLAAGTGLWAIGLLAMLPALRVVRPAWRSGLTQNAVNIAAHAVFGVAVQLLTEELTRQLDHRETSDSERSAARVA
jgi:hypothetical protein